MQDIFHKVLNSKHMDWRRKDLRKRSTMTEGLLWQKVRNNQLEQRFKRQYSIVHYVVDFYCAKAKLAIEVDGEVHKTIASKKYDEYRTQYINSLGIREIRFHNNEIINDLDTVIRKIKTFLPSPEVRRGTEGEVI